MLQLLKSALAGVTLVVSLSACGRGWRPERFGAANDRLFTASVREFQRKKWDNAISGFERLTVQLPARDTLLPRSHFYLAKAHSKRGEHLLAAQAYQHVVESFPDDSLADEALLEVAREYGRLWRRPSLDATYGQSAITTYRTFLALYPGSAFEAEANREIARLEEWLARKDYENAILYLKRKAFDSGIIYLKDVIKSYPSAPTTRKAYVSLLEAYRAIKYRDDAADLCTTMRQLYPNDREVREACGPAPTTATP
jgi:outer membrane assembly lipoprotein YfiO